VVNQICYASPHERTIRAGGAGKPSLVGKLSTKNQIVIPREIRDALGVKVGDRLLVVPRGDTVILLRKPKKYSKTIAGMGKGLFGPGYLAEERESWQ
jgi:AbrB family looped-hinge helix DNA binding protein